ncbi:hypothetical protein L1887_46919 [Cichorium endivia]|nr:hypothetical protein L1887_46919 [Cichorium endivia]
MLSLSLHVVLVACLRVSQSQTAQPANASETGESTLPPLPSTQTNKPGWRSRLSTPRRGERLPTPTHARVLLGNHDWPHELSSTSTSNCGGQLCAAPAGMPRKIGPN